MVRLPEGFMKTKYPGYFYNYEDNKLYSIKSGILKPLKHIKGGWVLGFYQHKRIFVEPGYSVSVEGRKMKVSDKYLNSLKNSPVEYIEVKL